jgi:hypothetical protein
MIDLSRPIENPELINAIEGYMKNPAQETEFRMVNAIKGANYISPVSVEGKIDGNAIQEGTTMTFALVINPNGDKFFPVFSDMSELRKWSETHQETLVASYNDMASLTITGLDGIKGFVINPFTQNIIVTQERINYIKSLEK